MKKGTRIYSILKLKCPRCQEGDLFVRKGWIVFGQILKMPEKCSHCHQDFKIEPGYYTAALWVSYPIVLLVFIPLILLGFALKNLNMFFTVLYPLIVIICFLFQIPLMRFTRATLLNFTVDYSTKW